MTITLDANPSDAPCCIKIIAADGRDLLIQTDWDWPGIATTFGWDIKSVQNVPACYADWQEGLDCTPEEHKACEEYESHKPCEHSHTDGTVRCKSCGLEPSQFLASARQYLDDNDGAEVEDPGYFDN